MERKTSGWGGKREGAGRKPDPNSGEPHLVRLGISARYPCHVTLKVHDDVPSLRTRKLVSELERSWAEAADRGTFRLMRYSIQPRQVDLIVEAKDTDALGRGMKALNARLARAVNRVFGRRGPVVKERFHHEILRTQTQVRNARALCSSKLPSGTRNK